MSNNDIIEHRLTAEEEKELGNRIAQGDQKALDKLITSNIGFVVSIARQYQNQGVSLDDLVSEGNIAMMLCAQKWNPEKGVRFVQYAVWDIRKAMSQTISQQSGLSSSSISVSKVSMDTPTRLGGITTYADRMQARDQKNAVEEAFLSSFSYGLQHAIGVLNERERKVISMFYGLNCDALTMAEIAENMGVTRERVRQIRKKAERKLRKPMRSMK